MVLVVVFGGGGGGGGGRLHLSTGLGCLDTARGQCQQIHCQHTCMPQTSKEIGITFTKMKRVDKQKCSDAAW